MHPDLIKKFSAPVPRYTSYPTAPHFSSDIGPETFAQWLLQDLTDTKPVSLYLHVPFCRELCWYCGCNTKATRQYKPIATYLEALMEEMHLMRRAVGRALPVAHVHLGGGSPDILAPSDIMRLGETVNDCFAIQDDTEIAVEIDPRNTDAERVNAFRQIGVSRVSFGVQDFDANVQCAINRHQSYELTADAIQAFRSAGTDSINIDLIYGLPRQTLESIKKTVASVIALKPDRIALFGYAHLPKRIVHQRMIDEASLPGATERFAQSNVAASMLTTAGYVRVGLDHFALPHDRLVTQPIQRNFQGYTTDDCATLLGLGASSISRLPSGFAQNAVPTANYMREIHAGRLATARGIALNDDDRLRSAIIDDLMCRFSINSDNLRQRFGDRADVVLEEADNFAKTDPDGLIKQTNEGFEVTEHGRPFVRTICAHFDAYLQQSSATHASGV